MELLSKSKTQACIGNCIILTQIINVFWVLLYGLDGATKNTLKKLPICFLNWTWDMLPSWLLLGKQILNF